MNTFLVQFNSSNNNTSNWYAENAGYRSSQRLDFQKWLDQHGLNNKVKFSTIGEVAGLLFIEMSSDLISRVKEYENIRNLIPVGNVSTTLRREASDKLDHSR